MKEFDIEKEIEKTLGSLDSHERVEASPFFYTKLEQRLKKNEEVKEVSFSIWSLVQPALMAIFIFVNIFTIVRFTENNENQLVNSLASDYGINVSENNNVQDYIFDEE